MNLSDQLKAMQEENNKRIPKFISNYMTSLTNYLKEHGHESKAMQVGSKLPKALLLTHRNKKVFLSEKLNNKPAIISFYRGAWCPYCNLELRAYEAIMKELTNQSFNFLAISPEMPDSTISTTEVDSLHFSVLSDKDNTFAKKMGLVYKTTWLLRLLYRLDGISLKKSQGNSLGELPIPATYVVDSDGIITHAWIDADYTHRGNPKDVLAAVSSL